MSTRSLFIAIGWLVICAALLLWLRGTDHGDLINQLRHLHFWALEVQFVSALSLTLHQARRLVRAVNAPLLVWLVVFAAGGSSYLISSRIAPRTSRILYDEQIYQNVAQNLADLHEAQMCNEGVVEYGRLSCFRPEYNKEPYGYPHVIGLAYRLFGVRESLAFTINNLCAGLLPVFVFLAATFLFRSTGAGAWAAIIAALVPQQHLWSNTAAAEPSAALAGIIVVAVAAYFVATRTAGALAWLTAVTAFALQFRPESVLLLPLVGCLLALEAREEFTRSRFWLATLVGLTLSAPLIGHMFAMRAEGWGATGARFSVVYLLANLRPNTLFYVSDGRFPVLYAALAVLGLAAARRRSGGFFTLLYFAAFWGIFLLFYAGSYNYGADVRYALMTYAPIAMLAGVGMLTISNALTARGLQRPLVAAALTGAVLAQFTWYLPRIREVGEEGWAARVDVDIAREFVPMIPAGAFVLTHDPAIFQVWGRNAGQTSIAAENAAYVQSVLASRFADGVYFHWNFWCNTQDPVQAGFCSRVLDTFEHRLVQERRVRDQRYALYRLIIPPPHP